MINFVIREMAPQHWWARAAWRYLTALAHVGADVKVIWKSNIHFEEDGFDPAFDLARNYLMSAGTPDVSVLMGTVPQALMFLNSEEKTERNVALVHWPTRSVPDHVAKGMQGYDRIVVPAASTATAFQRAGLEQTRHIPIPEFRLRPEVDERPARYTYYAIGNWDAPSNLEQVLRVYIDSFRPQDDVHLHLMCPDIPGTDDEWLATWAEGKALPPVSIEATLPRTEEELAILHETCSIYVAANSRSDLDPYAWGAACAGNPVLASLSHNMIGAKGFAALAVEADVPPRHPDLVGMLPDSEWLWPRLTDADIRGARGYQPPDGKTEEKRATYPGVDELGAKLQAVINQAAISVREVEVPDVDAYSIGVVITYQTRSADSYSQLIDTVDTVMDQLPGDTVAVVVQGASEDEVRFLVEKAKMMQGLTVVQADPPDDDCGWSLASARNAGAAVVVGEGVKTLAFVDADLVTSDFYFPLLLDGLGPMEARAPIVVEGGVMTVTAARTLHEGYDLGDGWASRPATGCIAISSEAFGLMGGYDERFVGWGEEDTEFLFRFLRQGGSLSHAKGAIAYHQPHPRQPDKLTHKGRRNLELNMRAQSGSVSPWDSTRERRAHEVLVDASEVKG